MRDDRIHLIQHVSFTGTAVLFWWGLVRGRYGRLGYGAALLYIFATAVHSGGLGALLTFSERPWYAVYARREAGLDALGDQQLAGLIIWVPAGIVMMLFGLALFAAWLGEGERRRQRLRPTDTETGRTSGSDKSNKSGGPQAHPSNKGPSNTGNKGKS